MRNLSMYEINYNNLIKKFTDIHNDCFPFKKIKFKSKSKSPGLLKAYLSQLKERIYFINLILSLLIVQTKRNLLHIETN